MLLARDRYREKGGADRQTEMEMETQRKTNVAVEM